MEKRSARLSSWETPNPLAGRDPDWWDLALCATLEARKYDFFSDDPEMQLACAYICRQCPVISACAEEALLMKLPPSACVWGGIWFSDLGKPHAIPVKQRGPKRLRR